MEKSARKKRKAKVDEGDGDENEVKKQKTFCGETFRKELNKQNLVASLKEFLNLAQQDKDEVIITEYLEAGGSVQEMLLLLDETAKSDLTSALPVFRVLHLIFLSVKDSDSKFYAQAENGAKFMLDSFIPTIEAMININSSKHRRAVLKVLTSIVTLFPSFGREVLNLIPTTPAVLSQFLQTQSGPDSVRKWFIFFILSFIVSGDIALIKILMSMKGLLSDIILGLKTDEADTIDIFLSVVKQKILENIKIPKTLKLKVFYTQVIVSLFELYMWKDAKTPNMLSKKKVVKPKVVNADEKELVTESVHDFILVLCTSKKLGVAFSDETFGTAREAKNNLLSSVIQSIPDFWLNKRMSEAVIAIVVACPDVMGATLARTDAFVQPRESEMWIKLIQFILNLLEAVSPKDILKAAQEVPEVNLLQLAKKFCTPSHLIRSLGNGIRKKDCFSVLYYSMRVLTLLWKKTEEVISAFEDNEKLRTALTGAYTTCIMKVDEVLVIWRCVCKLPNRYESVEKQQFLNIILEYLDMYPKCQKNVVETPSRIAVSMLNAVDAARESLGERNYLSVQCRIFYLLIAADPESVTPDTDMFKKAVTLLLTDNSTQAIKSVTTLILSTGVFKYNESEIDIWLACYFEHFQKYKQLLPEAFAYCISRLYYLKVNSEESSVKESTEAQKNCSGLTNRDTSAVVKGTWINSLTESPMLKQVLKLVKDEEDMKELRDYVSYVIFRLYHYYNNNNNNSEALVKFCEKYSRKVSPEVLGYIKEGDIIRFIADRSELVTKVEKTLLTWLTKRKKQLELESVFNMETTYNFSLFLVFNTITSYMISRVKSDSLSEDDERKLCDFFSFFMVFGSGSNMTSHSSSSVLAYDVKDPCRLRVKCVQYLFSLPLIDSFDVCEYEKDTIMNFTKIITGTLMNVSEEDLKNSTVFQPWKRKILNRIKTNLRDKDRTMEVFAGLEPILNRFSYTPDEVKGILREYGNMTDLKTFVDDGQVTMSTMMIIKFLKYQCKFSELNSKCFKKLQSIMKNMIEEGGNDLNVLDECFVYLLKNKPLVLSLFTNDFLEALLRRSDSNENMVTLCKLLLSDPAKTNHFIKFAKKNFKDLKHNKAIVIMASVVVLSEEDSLLGLLRSRRFCRYWKENELVEKEKASKLMNSIYKTYRKYIFGEKMVEMEFVLQHQRFFSLLAKCFLDEECLSDMKNNILQGSFQPEIIHKTILKYKDNSDIVETYTKGLLGICSRELKKVESGTCDEKKWSEFGRYMGDIVSLEKESHWDSVISSAIWKDFVRFSLRVCFNFPNCPSFMKTIRHFIELLYAPGSNNRDVNNIFDMVISHSQFLSVMLQESHLKSELVKLYYSLIKRNSEVLSLKHIPVILASYTGSLSENDVTLLNILHFYETHNLNMNEYEPVVWGEPAITHYSVKTNVGMSLWRRINMFNVLEMLDAKRMTASLEDFPVTRSGLVDERVVFNEKVYDPAFLLPIFTNLLSPGAVTYCLPFVQRGCFAYTVRALSSTSKEIRISASVVLARFYNHLELVQMMKLKPVWLHFINCLRYAIEDIATKPVPSVVTYFLAKTSLELSGEPGDMFSSLQKFLLAKPVFNFDYIPEFLPLFHSSDVNYMKHRRWILEIMRDGFKQDNDLDLLFQTMAVKIILSYFRSQFCTRELKPLVLEVVTNILKIPKSKFLISEYGLLTWLNGVSLTCKIELVPPFIKLLSAATAVTVRTKLSSNIFYPIQLLNILMNILPNLVECRSTAIVESYLATLFDCLFMLFRLKHTTWCKLNRSKLQDLSNVIATVSGERRLAEKYIKSKFFFGFCDMPNAVENSYRKIAFIWNVLSGFICENKRGQSAVVNEKTN